MARRAISLDEKIRKAEAAVASAKAKSIVIITSTSFSESTLPEMIEG